MKTTYLLPLALAFLTMLGCNRNDMNAISVEAPQVRMETILQRVESPKIEETKESTPVFSKKEQLEFETYLSLVDQDSLDPTVPLIEEKQYKYVLQLACVTDLERLKTEQERLQSQGYETNISKRFSNGIAYYRLRLNGTYSNAEAISLGQEIVRKFSSISDYIVLKIN
jgi:cell division septation protein DedD